MAIIQVGLQILGGVLGSISKRKKKKLADYAMQMEQLNVDSVAYFQWLTSKYKTYRTYKKVIKSHLKKIKNGEKCTMTDYLRTGVPTLPLETTTPTTNVQNFKGAYASGQHFADGSSSGSQTGSANPLVVGEMIYWLGGAIAVWLLKKYNDKN